MIIGYTGGVFDLFHIGHLNILKNAKAQCDYLIVGVSTNECAKYKGKTPIISLEDRLEIIKAIKYVDEVYIQYTLDKIKIWEELHYNKLFIGSDWKNNERYLRYEKELKQKEVSVIYLPYTNSISSTKIKEIIKNEK